MPYRLLTRGDVIQVGDEILLDDCETWDKEFYASASADGKHFLGQAFDPGFFVPMRRQVEA